MVFASRKEYTSPQNGTIIVDRFLWYTSIIVNNCLEAGLYLILMWKDALTRLPKKAKIKNVLLLGLGGGNVIRLLQKRYPEANITVVEWDEVMISLAKELGLFTLTPSIKIVHKDAEELLRTMSETFDLVIVDLFTGPTPPVFLGNKQTILNIQKTVKRDGYLFVNVYRHTEYLPMFQEELYTEEIWKYKLNTLALFKQKGSGSKEVTIPEAFIDMRQSEDFLKGSFKYGEILKDGGVYGVRHTWWPMAIDYYISDKEPVLRPWKGLRMVTWDRIHGEEKQKGWHQMIPGFGLSTAVVSDLDGDMYWKGWSETARRYRTKWDTQTDYEIVAMSRDEFAKYYLKFGRPKQTRRTCMNSLDNRIAIHKENINLFGLRHLSTGNYVAGIATIDAPEISQSYYLIAFLDKTTAPATAGLWLINRWFLHCKNTGIRFANFGPVWTPGQPKSWKGFTEFKSHFRPHTLRYKRPLFKITFSW